MREFFAARSRDHHLLAAGVAVASLLVMVLVAVAGRLDWWQPALVVVTVLSWYVRAGFGVPALILAADTAAWIVGVQEVLTPWTVAVVWLLVVVHASTALDSTMPPLADLPRSLWLLWARHVAIAGVLGSLVWLLTWLALQAHPPAYVWLMFLGLLAVGGLGLLLRRLSVGYDG